MSDLQFKSKTAQEIESMEQQEREEKLLSEGLGSFEVIVAEAKTSQAGHPMIKIKMKVWDSSGKSGFVDDFLMSGDSSFFIKKIKNFCEVVGIEDKYNSGKLSAEDISPGLNGDLTLVRKPYKGEMKNNIKEYIKRENSVDSRKPIDGLNDDIPW